MPPCVSVIMSAYNHRDYVAESIGSVLNQTFRDFEFLNWDDHSTDGTDDIIRSFSDLRIRAYYQNVNTRGCSAFLRSKAVGQYLESRITTTYGCRTNWKSRLPIWISIRNAGLVLRMPR